MLKVLDRESKNMHDGYRYGTSLICQTVSGDLDNKHIEGACIEGLND